MTDIAKIYKCNKCGEEALLYIIEPEKSTECRKCDHELYLDLLLAIVKKSKKRDKIKQKYQYV